MADQNVERSLHEGLMIVIPRRQGIIGLIEAVIAPRTGHIEVLDTTGIKEAQIAAIFGRSDAHKGIEWTGHRVDARPGRGVKVWYGAFVSHEDANGRLLTKHASDSAPQNYENLQVLRRGVLQDWTTVFHRKALLYLDAKVSTTRPRQESHGTV